MDLPTSADLERLSVILRAIADAIVHTDDTDVRTLEGIQGTTRVGPFDVSFEIIDHLFGSKKRKWEATLLDVRDLGDAMEMDTEEDQDITGGLDSTGDLTEE